MKAKYKGKITSVDKVSGEVTLSFETPTAGKVDTRAINAQDTYLSGKLMLRELVADQMKIGAVLTITVSDEEPDERLT